MMSWYELVPKVELHVHLEGAIPHGALFDLIRKYGGDPEVPDVGALARRFEYRGFPQFIEAWIWKNRFLREYEDFTHIAELTARDMVEQKIRYSEMFFSPSTFRGIGLETGELTRAVRKGLARVPEIEVNLIADLVRDYGPEFELRTLLELAEVRSEGGVVGIGIGGSEHRFPPEPFEELFRVARRLGFHTNAHGGEAAGPESIRGAVERLEVERIGHGTSAIRDPELVELLAEQQIPLELCPGSNVKTGAVSSLEAHPVREYFDKGLLLSINTDDPKMFGTDLVNEYRQLVDRCGFTQAEIRQLILMAVRSSWLTEDRKASLAGELQQDPAWESVP